MEEDNNWGPASWELNHSDTFLLHMLLTPRHFNGRCLHWGFSFLLCPSWAQHPAGPTVSSGKFSSASCNTVSLVTSLAFCGHSILSYMCVFCLKTPSSISVPCQWSWSPVATAATLLPGTARLWERGVGYWWSWRSPTCSMPVPGRVKTTKGTKLMASQPLPKSPPKWAGPPFAGDQVSIPPQVWFLLLISNHTRFPSLLFISGILLWRESEILYFKNSSR